MCLKGIFKKGFLLVWMLSLFGFTPLFASEAPAEKKTVSLTQADAALVIAKYSGFFDQYIAPDASLDQCLFFFDQHGISFDYKEVMSGQAFTTKDAARIMGQINLLLRGNARRVDGQIALPCGVDSWTEYCTMNEVEFMEMRQAMIKTLCLLREKGE